MSPSFRFSLLPLPLPSLSSFYFGSTSSLVVSSMTEVTQGFIVDDHGRRTGLYREINPDLSRERLGSRTHTHIDTRPGSNSLFRVDLILHTGPTPKGGTRGVRGRSRVRCVGPVSTVSLPRRGQDPTSPEEVERTPLPFFLNPLHSDSLVLLRSPSPTSNVKPFSSNSLNL